uniref:tetraacyldisaccharide 4'-kinase n=1 Tax=Prevotella sp. TaxID=59823 RepID=UPI004028A06A
LAPLCNSIIAITFGDHLAFTDKDIEYINQRYQEVDGDKVIVTTEKDATRLTEIEGLSEEIKSNIYVLPIHVTFMLGQGEKFNHKILSYVRKNSRNAKLLKAKNEQSAKNSSKPVNKPRTISFKNN